MNQTEREERDYLTDLMSRLREALHKTESTIDTAHHEIIDAKQYLWENRSELDPAETTEACCISPAQEPCICLHSHTQEKRLHFYYIWRGKATNHENRTHTNRGKNQNYVNRITS